MSAQASTSESGTTSQRGRGELSVFDKGRIVGEGVSKKEIGRRLGRNESTIRTFLKRQVYKKEIKNLS